MMKQYNKKIHQYLNLISYIKKSNFFFIILNNGSFTFKKISQLQKLKVFNFQTKKVLKISIKKNILPVIRGPIFFFKLFTNKKTLLIKNNLSLLLPCTLIINLNNKMYNKNSLKTINCFNYLENKKLVYKFFVLKLKSSK